MPALHSTRSWRPFCGYWMHKNCQTIFLIYERCFRPTEELMAVSHNRPFDVIVFDLGGVLIELAGVNRMLELLQHRITVEELWTRWLTSTSVHQFETGQIEAQQFAQAVLAEFDLPISATQFLDEFTAWPQG